MGFLKGGADSRKGKNAALMKLFSAWVQRWATQWPAGATVLDLACGSGRHANLLAAMGFQVTGVDRDPLALAALAPTVRALQADLEDTHWPLLGQQFDAVLVTNYLWRPHWPELLRCVRDWYVHETFAVGQELLGRPKNPDFLLKPGELLQVCEQAGLQVVGYEDGVVNGSRVQRVAARRRRSESRLHWPLLESPVPQNSEP
jgi:SAM-dependent methyltransferase